MRLAESVLALGIAGVEDCAVGKYDARRHKLSVAVGMRAAVHSRCIVHNDSTYHSRILRSRVGRKDASKGFQKLIYALTDDARLHRDGFRIGGNFIIFPIFACHDEDAVAQRLSAETRAGGTERHRQTTAAGCRKQTRHLLLRLRAHHNLRHKAVEAGIGAPRQAAHLVCVDALAWDKCAYFF